MGSLHSTRFSPNRSGGGGLVPASWKALTPIIGHLQRAAPTDYCVNSRRPRAYTCGLGREEAQTTLVNLCVEHQLPISLTTSVFSRSRWPPGLHGPGRVTYPLLCPIIPTPCHALRAPQGELYIEGQTSCIDAQGVPRRVRTSRGANSGPPFIRGSGSGQSAGTFDIQLGRLPRTAPRCWCWWCAFFPTRPSVPRRTLQTSRKQASSVRPTLSHSANATDEEGHRSMYLAAECMHDLERRERRRKPETRNPRTGAVWIVRTKATETVETVHG